jgi:excisionase family DNA binding protein
MNLTFEQLPQAVNQLFSKLESIEKLLIAQTKQPPTEQPDTLLTVQQAAEFLNLTVPTIYSKVSKSELPVMKRGKRLYFSQCELLEYLQAGRKKSNAEIEAEANAYLLSNKKGLKL